MQDKKAERVKQLQVELEKATARNKELREQLSAEKRAIEETKTKIMDSLEKTPTSTLH